ncbi:HNH endonuclease signature motif containing protein [Nonomuraea sp. NPDC000554]|uniref:HNH endonuclease signature motif containing protein n=1 Tax=Nonomuraea sp. NPDC000554 TaxID=3154259 RepID=UPI003333B7F3
MKRGNPLRRRTELKPGKPLERKTPLRSAGNLERATPLRKQSKKRQQENRERRRVVDAKYGTGLVRCEVPGCTSLADDAHEVLTRARGGSITDPDNIRAVCRPHHDEIGTEPVWAYELGFLRHSWEVA